MKATLWCAVFAVLSGVAPFACPEPTAQAANRPGRQKWEYKVLTFSGLLALVKDDEAILKDQDATRRLSLALNKLGEDGWELVTFSQAGTYIFKRPK
jgi:hypothetical protein